MSRLSLLPLLLLAAPLAWTTQTPSFKPGKLPKEEVARLKPGLLLRFEDARSAPLDARVSRLAALHVPEGSQPWLPPTGAALPLARPWRVTENPAFTKVCRTSSAAGGASAHRRMDVTCTPLYARDRAEDKFGDGIEGDPA